MNLVDHLTDSNLFGPCFRDPKTWAAWHVVLRALYGNTMTKAERTMFTALTGRQEPPSEQVSEAWFIVGRRGGKSFVTALVAVYAACFVDYTKHLAPGAPARPYGRHRGLGRLRLRLDRNLGRLARPLPANRVVPTKVSGEPVKVRK